MSDEKVDNRDATASKNQFSNGKTSQKVCLNLSEIEMRTWSPRFKSLIKKSLFILIVYSLTLADEVT